jgi:hypothetical protein
VSRITIAFVSFIFLTANLQAAPQLSNTLVSCLQDKSSQINISADGLSAGVGYGSFKGTGEVAVGIGYGGKLKNGTRFQLSAGKNGSATGAGFSMQFGGGD